MCELCRTFDSKVAQYKRALYGADPSTEERLTSALRDLMLAKPLCVDPEPLSLIEAEVVDLQLHRIVKALDSMALPEIRELVEEIETALKPKED